MNECTCFIDGDGMKKFCYYCTYPDEKEAMEKAILSQTKDKENKQ